MNNEMEGIRWEKRWSSTFWHSTFVLFVVQYGMSIFEILRPCHRGDVVVESPVTADPGLREGQLEGTRNARLIRRLRHPASRTHGHGTLVSRDCIAASPATSS